jgi:hypothetical protein
MCLGYFPGLAPGWFDFLEFFPYKILQIYQNSSDLSKFLDLEISHSHWADLLILQKFFKHEIISKGVPLHCTHFRFFPHFKPLEESIDMRDLTPKSKNERIYPKIYPLFFQLF